MKLKKKKKAEILLMIHEVGWQDNPYMDTPLSAPAQRTLALILMNLNCNLNRFSFFLKGIDERSSNINDMER